MHKRLLTFSLIICSSLALLIAEEAGFSSYFGTYGLGDYSSSSIEYEDFFQWGGNIYYRNYNFSESEMGYVLEASADPILKYRYKSEIEILNTYYSIRIGPVFGIINQGWTLIKPGFTGFFRAQYPGKAFLDFGGETIPLRSSLLEKDYSSFSSFYSIGYYILEDHLLCYFTQKRDQYTELNDGLETTNEKTSYLFYSEFFEKNSFLRVKTKMGYEILNQSFSTTENIELKSIILGLNLDFGLSGNSSVYISMDNMIYPISSGSMELSEVPGYLYTFETGFKWYR